MLWFILVLCLILLWFAWGLTALGIALPFSSIPFLMGWTKNLTVEKFRFGFEIVSVIVALVGAFFLYQQNQQQAVQSTEELKVVREQIQAQSTETARQIEAQATLSAMQYKQQQSIYIDTRRTQLLETMYGHRDCDKINIEDCPFIASTRVRLEAAKVFIQFEREAGIRPDLSYIDLSRTGLSQSNFLTDTILLGANLSGSNLFLSDLRGALLLGANLSGANLSGSNLSRTGLTHANLSKSILRTTNLSEATLIEANLSGADLTKANLNSAILFQADLRETILLGANLNNADLNQAKYNLNTKWPDGFDPKSVGAIQLE
jgi:uncharacterized protein YjbI with pentapeptide repeats